MHGRRQEGPRLQVNVKMCWHFPASKHTCQSPLASLQPAHSHFQPAPPNKQARTEKEEADERQEIEETPYAVLITSTGKETKNKTIYIEKRLKRVLNYDDQTLLFGDMCLWIKKKTFIREVETRQKQKCLYSTLCSQKKKKKMPGNVVHGL